MTKSKPPEHPATLPVYVITGFLGSGKTTLLNHLVNHESMGDTAVIINEFGEVGLDHLLVESAIEDTVLMQSGCICCTIRGDLIDTLGDLLARVEQGELPKFARVVIETTGLADPAPVLQTLMTDPNVTGRYRLGGVVTTVDAVNGAGQIDEHPEPEKQAAVADRIVLTKTDLADRAQTAGIMGILREINPASPIFEVFNGEVEPDRLFDTGLYDPESKTPDVRKWLREEAYRDTGHDADADSHGHEHGDQEHGGNDVNLHRDDIRSFCLDFEEPVAWDALRAWLESVSSLRGPDLLRVKGIVNVAGEDAPVVIHGVQHIFHAPVRLDAWPDNEQRRTRMVFITRGLDPASLAAALDAARAAERAH